MPYTSTIQKVNYKLYTHKFIKCILLLCVHMCVYLHGVFVCICEWINTFVDMHACACSAQRLVFVGFYCPLAWFLRQDLSLNLNSPIVRLPGHRAHGMPRLLPSKGLQGLLQLVFYMDAGDGNLDLYACTASTLSTPSLMPLNCF